MSFPANNTAKTTPGFSLGTSTGGFNLPGTTPAATSTGLSFGLTPTTNTGFAMNAPTASAPSLNFGLGTTTSLGAPSTGLGITAPAAPLLGSTTAAPTSTGFGFGAAAATATKPAAGVVFGSPKTVAVGPLAGTATTISTPALGTATSIGSGFALGGGLSATAPATGISLGGLASIPASTGFTLGATTSVSIASSVPAAATTSATLIPPDAQTLKNLKKRNSGRVTSTSVTALSKPTTLQATSSPFASYTYSDLEQSINRWTIELEEQEKVFMNQVAHVNEWDRLLRANGDKILTLNSGVEKVKLAQQQLDHELDFIVAQQRELEECLAPLEKEFANISVNDPERDATYRLAENMNTQLKQMSDDLKEVMEHINEKNKNQDTSDPIVQIGRILNAHMNSLQWVDHNTESVKQQLDEVVKLAQINLRNSSTQNL